MPEITYTPGQYVNGVKQPNVSTSTNPTAITTPTGLSSIATPPPVNTNANIPTGTTPPPNGTPPATSGTGLPDSSFFGLLNNLNQGFQTNNQYVTQKNAVVNAMLGQPVDPATLATLPPEIQSVIQGGDRNQLLMQAKILNDQISGYGRGISSSIQYLTQGYQSAQQEADKQKEDALNVLKELYAEGNPTSLQNFIKTNYPSVDSSTANDIVNQVVGSVGISDAIQAQEGGQYTTVNKDSGALGKYQIMPFNIGNVMNPTTGKPLDGKNPKDVQLFLNTPALQDQAYQKIISDLSAKYNGDPAKIAAAYYGGAGGVTKYGTPAGDVKQGNYPSINDYVKQVLSKLPTQNSSGADYNQYGLLATIPDFDPKNQKDKDAYAYLNSYIKNGTFPTYYSLFGRTQGKNLQDTAALANDLFYKATGQSLPDVQILKGNKALINANNKLENNLNIQEGTVGKNFALAIANIDKNGINQSAQPINSFIDNIKNLMGDPDVAQYITQNGTLQNEVGSLIAIKNASGTTVADKLASAGLVPKNASEKQQKAVLKTLLQEAQNGFDTIKATSGDLYKQIDPLETDPNNPNKQNSNSATGGSYQDYLKAIGGQ